MKLEEGTCWTQKADKVGGSYVLILTPEMREYLGIDKDDNGDVWIIVKADKASRKGHRFIGIGKAIKKSEG